MCAELGGDGMRRMLLDILRAGGDEVGLKYKTGEFIGDGSLVKTIEHGLGEVPFLFAFITDVTGEETARTTSSMFMNTGLATRYTSSASKQWSEVGNTILNDGTNAVSNVSPSSAGYGVQSVDENQIRFVRYGSNQNFIDGKTYKWIAIADWRS